VNDDDNNNNNNNNNNNKIKIDRQIHRQENDLISHLIRIMGDMQTDGQT
jgi:hypothetical protein